jgi:two-component system nitrogen regulation response regulator GlnG
MKILLLDSDREMKDWVLSNWSVPNTEIIESSGGQSAIKLISQGGLGAVFLSTEFLTIENLDMLTLIKEHNPGVEVFIISDRKDTSQAETAVRKGAHSTLVRPVNLSLMESLVKKVVSRALTRKNHRILEDHLVIDLLGRTPAMEKILSTISKVAPTKGHSQSYSQAEQQGGRTFCNCKLRRHS